ncbi:hypothetical protein [Flaviflagellibacter deserti]|uniref:Helix-turn-helix domain-containing protein n=1 Tax=Flaviflagellibacter deserti TaxID=2267266 RepID=A0ABV9Z2C3_9HYPH
MPRTANKKGRSIKEARHLRLYHWLVESEAWRSLSPQARAIYVEIEHRYNGVNNGRIGFGCREAAEHCRINKNTASRALKELQEKGFIRLRLQGTFHRKDRHQSEWVLTAHPTDDANATKDFRQWHERKSSVPRFHTDEASLSYREAHLGGQNGAVVALNSYRQA